jgi:hypothetical protein
MNEAIIEKVIKKAIANWYLERKHLIYDLEVSKMIAIRFYKKPNETESFCEYYLEVFTSKEFIEAFSRFLWNESPKSKWRYPKVMWYVWQLNYENIDWIISDFIQIQADAIFDWKLEEFYQSLIK